MYDTDDESRALQVLLDRSHGASGEHLCAIVNPRGRSTLFLHGRFWVGTDEAALPAAHVHSQPALSLCHFVGDEIGI